LGDRVSALWNAANYTCRQSFIAGEHILTYASLCKTFRTDPAYRALPSDIAQETLKKLSEAWKSFWVLRTQWRHGMLAAKPGLPRYRKDRTTGERPSDFIPIKCARSYRVYGRTVALTLPKDVSATRLVMPYRGLRRYQGMGRRAEIGYDHGRQRWYMVYTVAVPAHQHRSWTRVAGIDLGVRVLAAMSIAGTDRAVHFLGRDVLKDW
jgi:transposase